jgi:hypothetical protein
VFILTPVIVVATLGPRRERHQGDSVSLKLLHVKQHCAGHARLSPARLCTAIWPISAGSSRWERRAR